MDGILNIEHIPAEGRGEFILLKDNQEVGELTYIHHPPAIIINHTEIKEEHRGNKWGNLLIDKAVAFCRANQLKIIAFCPFVKYRLEQNPAYADVISKE